jgi:diguanylate cyclase (GGDEF)-like protein
MKSEKRLTIGVLIGYQIYGGSTPSPFASPIIRGIQAAARDENINLMVSCGSARIIESGRFRPAWPDLGEETDFVPVGPWNTAGLLILDPLRTKKRIHYARQLIESGFPIFFIGIDSGPPAIIVDNEGGIRQAMDHLVWHGHREIAFIAGDEQDLGDSSLRLCAYQKGVQDLALSDDPRLTEYGRHWEIGGYQAMQRILHSGVKFTAVMCSNDESALGVVKALQEAGIRIPWDVAVTGFDDVLEGLALVPPLTTVHYPLFETGYRSLLLLHKRIKEGPQALPDTLRISTWLIPRQSCGCLPEIVTKAAISGGSSIPCTNQILPPFRERLTQAILETLHTENPQSNDRDLSPFCGRLVDGFFQSLEDGDYSHFQIALTEILQRVEMMIDANAYVWQSAISVLRQEASAVLKDDPESIHRERAEDLLHQARTLLSESAERRYTRLQVQEKYHNNSMGVLTALLLSSVDEDQVYAALREDLPQVGVRTCHVVFFEPLEGDPVAVSRLHSLEVDAPILRFETRQFPPAGLYAESEPFSLAILPLIFQKQNLGYVAFDGENLEPLATVVLQLSSAIQSAKLHTKVVELSLTDSLTDVHNRRYLEISLQKETERSQRYNRDLAVIMIDIDHFKEYNDAFRHLAGDEALCEVARCITQGARRGLDEVTRYGGEEFAIILPETNAEGAGVVAENVRKLVEANHKFHRPLTVSLGIAALHGDQLRSPVLVGQADRALYQAKQQGRNRVVVFEEWMTEVAHGSVSEISPSGVVPPPKGE